MAILVSYQPFYYDNAFCLNVNGLGSLKLSVYVFAPLYPHTLYTLFDVIDLPVKYPGPSAFITIASVGTPHGKMSYVVSSFNVLGDILLHYTVISTAVILNC